jgi:hypothetical protein
MLIETPPRVIGCICVCRVIIMSYPKYYELYPLALGLDRLKRVVVSSDCPARILRPCSLS